MQLRRLQLLLITLLYLILISKAVGVDMAAAVVGTVATEISAVDVVAVVRAVAAAALLLLL